MEGEESLVLVEGIGLDWLGWWVWMEIGGTIDRGRSLVSATLACGDDDDDIDCVERAKEGVEYCGRTSKAARTNVTVAMRAVGFFICSAKPVKKLFDA